MTETPYNREGRRAAWDASKERVQAYEVLRRVEPELLEKDNWVESLNLGGEPFEEIDDWDTAPIRPAYRGTAGEWPEEQYLELQEMSTFCCLWRGVA